MHSVNMKYDRIIGLFFGAPDYIIIMQFRNRKEDNDNRIQLHRDRYRQYASY